MLLHWNSLIWIVFCTLQHSDGKNRAYSVRRRQKWTLSRIYMNNSAPSWQNFLKNFNSKKRGHNINGSSIIWCMLHVHMLLGYRVINLWKFSILSGSLCITHSSFMVESCGEEALLISVICITKCQLQAALSVLRTNFAMQGSVIIIIININIKDWTFWSFPSPNLRLLCPTFLRSSNCSPSLWSVAVWFQRDSVLWHSLQVFKTVPSVFIYLV